MLFWNLFGASVGTRSYRSTGKLAKSISSPPSEIKEQLPGPLAPDIDPSALSYPDRNGPPPFRCSLPFETSGVNGRGRKRIVQGTFAIALRWNNDDKHATNTDEYIANFIKTHGKDYAKCFKRPCPYYEKLDIIYDGMKNKANGEHVVHLASKC
ncbi:hypothetical protein B0H14DRAFT_3499888 [Mycena olivaceomarginata]|nr:hypothetical protein B0H14DRAFT_3499888 [Mycena olivaceomarginata]